MSEGIIPTWMLRGFSYHFPGGEGTVEDPDFDVAWTSKSAGLIMVDWPCCGPSLCARCRNRARYFRAMSRKGNSA